MTFTIPPMVIGALIGAAFCAFVNAMVLIAIILPILRSDKFAGSVEQAVQGDLPEQE